MPDADSQGRYGVQCDVDAEGILTYVVNLKPVAMQSPELCTLPHATNGQPVAAPPSEARRVQQQTFPSAVMLPLAALSQQDDCKSAAYEIAVSPIDASDAPLVSSNTFGRWPAAHEAAVSPINALVSSNSRLQILPIHYEVAASPTGADAATPTALPSQVFQSYVIR